MPSEVRDNRGTRVELKPDKPSFDLAAEAKKERAKMGGNTPPVQPPSMNKAKPRSADHLKEYQFKKKPINTAPHFGSDIKNEIEKLEKN